MRRYLTEGGKPTHVKREAARDALGRYRFEIIVRAHGKQLRRRYWLAGEADALREEDALRTGRGVAGLTWLAALDAWESGKPRSGSYTANARRNIERLAKRVGNRPVVDTSLPEFIGWTQAEARERGARTGQTCHTHALSVAHWAQSEGLIPPDALPFEHARKPRYDPKPRNPFKPEELPEYGKRLSAEALPLYLFLGLSGVRAFEGCGLKLDGIADGVATFVQKGGDLRRLPLDETLNAVLRMAEKVRKERGCRSGTVFVNSKGRPWTVGTFLQHCVRRWKGLPKHRPHELRHGFGTAAGKRFVPDAIRAGMGHATRAASETYVHPDEATAAEVGGAVRATFMQHLGVIMGEKGGKGRKARAGMRCPHCGKEIVIDKGVTVQVGKK